MVTVKRHPLLLLGAVGLVLAAVLVWRVGRRVPVEQARRFLTAPLEVGEQPPPAPPSAAGAAEVARRYDDGTAAFKAGRYEEAAEAFAWVVAQDPGGARAGPAQWNLTRSRLRSGDGDGALIALHDLVGHHAGWLGTAAPALREGLERMAQGDLAAAQAAYERMIREQPDSELVPLAWAMVARVEWAHGEAMGMVRAFAKMLGSVKDAVPAYAHLSYALGRYADGAPDAADEFAAMARTGDPGFRDIYQYLAARSLLEQGRFEETRAALEQLRRDHPDGDFTHIKDLEDAWNLLRNGRAGEALAIFERLQHTDTPAHAQGFDEFFDIRAELPMGIARCQLALGHYPEAVTAFERALREQPHGIYVVENHLGLASAYEGMGQFDHAAAELRELVEQHPDEPSLWAIRQQLARVEGRVAALRTTGSQ